VIGSQWYFCGVGACRDSISDSLTGKVQLFKLRMVERGRTLGFGRWWSAAGLPTPSVFAAIGTHGARYRYGWGQKCVGPKPRTREIPMNFSSRHYLVIPKSRNYALKCDDSGYFQTLVRRHVGGGEIAIFWVFQSIKRLW
tara:strand:- start:285 stop:704 length:420 start_codon:yes stop_codon:yes gene_type:complete